jgi:hypothetical protein
VVLAVVPVLNQQMVLEVTELLGRVIRVVIQTAQIITAVLLVAVRVLLEAIQQQLMFQVRVALVLPQQSQVLA